MSVYYVLDDRHHVVSCDFETWNKWRQENGVHVADEMVYGHRVSTVFLGIDHSFGGPNAAPVLFETLVFGGPLNGEMVRYGTWEAAELGHAEMVARVRGAAVVSREAAS